MFFVLLASFRTFSKIPYLLYIGGQYWWVGRNLNGIASTPSVNEPAKDLILVHIVQLKPMMKAQISGRMVSSGISDVMW